MPLVGPGGEIRQAGQSESTLMVHQAQGQQLARLRGRGGRGGRVKFTHDSQGGEGREGRTRSSETTIIQPPPQPSPPPPLLHPWPAVPPPCPTAWASCHHWRPPGWTAESAAPPGTPPGRGSRGESGRSHSTSMEATRGDGWDRSTTKNPI